MLFSREVIFTEDVEKIFGKRQWISRTDEILAAQQAREKAEAAAKAEKHPVEDVEATEASATPDGADASGAPAADNPSASDKPADIPPVPKK